MTTPNTIAIDGVQYVRADSIDATPPVSGSRVVLVVDRGWIFAGDVDPDDEGEDGTTIVLKRALHVRSWDSVGFDGMLANPTGGKVVLKKLPGEVRVPYGSEIFRVPVADNWGL